MLDLIEHLVGSVRGVAVFIVCLARAICSTSARHGAAARFARARSSSRRCREEDGGTAHRRARSDGSDGLAALCRAARGGARDHRGQPVVHRGDGAGAVRVRRAARRAPAHGAGDDRRPDRPFAPPGEGGAAARRRCRARVLVRRGRGDAGGSGAAAGLAELVDRDFLVREQRSTIRGEEAYRFKHVLIRDVAYAGLRSRRGPCCTVGWPTG